MAAGFAAGTVKVFTRTKIGDKDDTKALARHTLKVVAAVKNTDQVGNQESIPPDDSKAAMAVSDVGY